MDHLKIDSRTAADHREAARIFREEGLLILTHAVSNEYADRLKTRMDSDTLELLRFCDTIGGNPRRNGQLQQSPPPFPPYLSEEVLANPLVWDIVTEVLGRDAHMVFIGGNTNCPGSQAQSIHLDQAHKDGIVTAATSIILNYAPQDITSGNGAMEIWPRTHTVAAAQIVSDDQLEHRRRENPPYRLRMSRNDLVLRDPRLWHRGVTNPSGEFRHLTGIVIHATRQERAVFDHTARPFFDKLCLPLDPVYEDLKSTYLTQPTLDMVSSQASTGKLRPLEGL